MSRRLRFLLVANAILLALWVWARLERQTITIVVSPSGAVAYDEAGLKLASVPSSGAPANESTVGLFLRERHLPGTDRQPGFLVWLGQESAWESLTVKRSSDGATLLHEQLVSGLGVLLPSQQLDAFSAYSGSNWPSYTVSATLLRGRDEAGIAAVGSRTSARVFLFRPEHRDGAWIDLTPAGLSPPISAIPYATYKKPLLEIGQNVVRLLLGAYPAALVLELLIGAAGILGSIVIRRSRVSTRQVAAPAAAGQSTVGDQAGGLDQTSPTPAPAPEARPRGKTIAPTIVALVLAGIGLAAGAFVATDRLERMPHVQDSVAYLFQAKVFALGRLWAPVPALPEFFSHEFVQMYQGKWFAIYTPGHPLLLALGVLAGAPWLVSPIAAGLSVLLIYLIGRRAYGWPTGLLAAGLALVSPFFLFLSGSFMAHSTGLLFVLLFVWLFLRSDRPLSAALAGAAIGFAFLIRPWTAGMVGAPFVVVALVDFLRAPRKRLPRYAAMLGAFVPFVIAWLAYTAALTGDPFLNMIELWWPFDKVGFGPDHGPFGFTVADGLWNTSRNLTELQAHLFGWPPYLTLVFVILPFVLARARRIDWLCLAGFLSLVAGYAAWWADGIMYGPRFYYESLGFLLLLTARGVFELAALARRALERWNPSAPAARKLGGVVAGSVLALLIGYNLYYYMPAQWQLYKGYNYVNRGPVNAVEQAGIRNALVFAYVGQPWEWWNYGMVFSSNSPLLDGDVVYARDLGDEKNRELMALYPGRSYYRLSGTVLTPLPGPGG